MGKEYLDKLKQYTDELLKSGNEEKPYWQLAKYNCSEVSRFIGIKVLHDLGESSKPFILKGDVTKNGINKDNLHDILGFYDQSSQKYILIDPTIWQFFPRKRNVYLGSFDSIDSAISFSKKYYEGEWELSEYVGEKTENLNEIKRIIKLNCDQAPNWER